MQAVYLIHGGEPLQTLEATTAVRVKLKNHGFIERKIFELNNSFNWDQLILISKELSLFSKKLLLELHLQDNKIGLPGSKTIMQFLNEPHEDICLLIIANKLDNSAQKTKWFTAIQQADGIITARPLTKEQFVSWTIARLKRFDFTASHEIIALLTKLYFGNLVALAQLIETIAICTSKGELLLEQIAPHLHNNTEFNIFNLVDAAIEEDCQKICQIVNRLKNDKAEPAIVLWGIARELRTLIKITFALEKGLSYAEICKDCGIWSSRSSRLRKYLNNTSRQQLENILQKLTMIDLIIKGVAPGLIWESLLTVYLEFANIKPIKNFNRLTI